jgi:hypothetical protein
MTRPVNPLKPSDRLRLTVTNQNPLAARRIGQQDANLEPRPEVVARIQHLRCDDRLITSMLNDRMIDADRRPEPELDFLPVEEVRRA